MPFQQNFWKKILIILGHFCFMYDVVIVFQFFTIFHSFFLILTLCQWALLKISRNPICWRSKGNSFTEPDYWILLVIIAGLTHGWMVGGGEHSKTTIKYQSNTSLSKLQGPVITVILGCWLRDSNNIIACCFYFNYLDSLRWMVWVSVLLKFTTHQQSS